MRQSLDKLLRILLIVLMITMVVSTLLQVLARFIGWNVPFTEELTIYAMMWVTLFGSAYTFGLKKHIAIDALVTLLKGQLRTRLEILIELIVASFAILILILGGSWLTIFTFKLGQLSPVMQIPKGWIYLAIPLSGFVILFYNVLNIAVTYSKGRKS